MRWRIDPAISSALPSHADTFDHLSSRNVRLPTWMSDMNAARTWCRVPRNVLTVGRSGRMIDWAITSPRSLTVPTMPTTSSRTAISEAPERRGVELVRQAGRGRRPGRHLSRGIPGDLTRAHHVMEGDDERRLRAGFEERLDALDGIALRQEELDRVRLEQRSAIAH